MDSAVQQALETVFKPVSDAVDRIVEANTAALKLANDQLALQSATITDLKNLLGQVLVPVSGTGDANLHLNWDLVVSSGVAPMNSSLVKGTDYGYRQQVSKAGYPPQAIELFFNRAIPGDYSGFLVAIHRPIDKTSGKLIFKGRFFHDDRASNGMQALEFDTLLTKAGFKYNLSSQINYQKGGVLQIVNDADGDRGWEDTPIVLGKPLANVWHDFQWEYWFDFSSKTFGYVAFTFDGTRYPIPQGEFTSQSALTSNWGDGLHCQLQIGTNSKGLPFAVAFDRLGYFTQ